MILFFNLGLAVSNIAVSFSLEIVPKRWLPFLVTVELFFFVIAIIFPYFVTVVPLKLKSPL